MILDYNYLSFDCYGVFLTDHDEPVHPLGIYDSLEKATQVFDEIIIPKKQIVPLKFYYKFNEYPKSEDIICVVIELFLDFESKPNYKNVQLTPKFATSDPTFINYANVLYSKFNPTAERTKTYQHAYLNIYGNSLWESSNISLN